MFFCAIVFRGLWPEKDQQTKGQQIIKFFFHFFPRKRFFLQKGAFGFRVVVIFLRWLSFFLACIRGEILKGSSGSTKRPASSSNWFSKVLVFDQFFASNLNILNENLYKNTIKIGVSSKMREAKKCVKNDQFERQFGDHRGRQFSSAIGGGYSACATIQGPHSRLIFRLARWSSNCLFGGPRTALQKAPFCRKKPFFLLFVVPELAFWEGLKWTRWRLSSIYIYICCEVVNWATLGGF